MSDQLVFQPSAAAIARTHTTAEQYDALYQRSITDPVESIGNQLGRFFNRR